MPRPGVQDIYTLQGQYIGIVTGKDIVQDKYEKNTITIYNNPIPIRAIVTDFTTAQAQWKMPGIITKKSKEIQVNKKYRQLIELSQKIIIDGEDYEGWKEHGHMQIRQIGQYDIRLYVYIKVV